MFKEESGSSNFRISESTNDFPTEIKGDHNVPPYPSVEAVTMATFPLSVDLLLVNAIFALTPINRLARANIRQSNW